jgi:hypothetical protein
MKIVAQALYLPGPDDEQSEHTCFRFQAPPHVVAMHKYLS